MAESQGQTSFGLLPDPVETLISNVSLLDGQGGHRERAFVLLEGGKIKSVSDAPVHAPDAQLIDGTNKWLTPGIVEIHSHIGISTPPYVPQELANFELNESADPNSAHVSVADAILVNDPAWSRAVAGGVTTLLVLPGSRNVFSGQGIVVKNVPARTVGDMQFPKAEPILKLACGENPKYAWGQKGRAFTTRMGMAAFIRSTLKRAQSFESGGNLGTAPDAAQLAVLRKALDGNMQVHVHCYRAEDIATIFDIAEEFGFRVAAIHHASEAFKIPDLFVRNNTCAVVWTNTWGFKLEGYDNIPENAAFLAAANACVALHTDSNIAVQRMNMEAANAMAAGRRAGIDISKATAISWITEIPARILGLYSVIGSIEAGKDADLVLWSGDPFSIRSEVDVTLINGVVVYDRLNGKQLIQSDFEIGQPSRSHSQGGSNE